MSENLSRRSFIHAAAGAIAGGGLTAAAQESGAGIRIIGISGSMRKGKTTAQALQIALDAAKAVSAYG